LKHRIHFDFKSLNFKLWAYFALFSALLMIVLWFLQIFFLTTYYQEMKIRETVRMASIIEKQYGKEGFLEKVYEFSITNDMYIQIQTPERIILPAPTEERIRPYIYVEEMTIVKRALLRSNELSVSVIIPEPRTDTNTLAYAAYLDSSAESPVILYLFSPLYPVSSTISILQRQLVYVMIISLILAFVISFYLSNRITRPIRNITSSAKKLAEGNYGIVFTGGHYTEIVNLADTLTYTSYRLEKTDTLQKDLMANVSHDLRTPLTMVKSYAEMIRDLSGDNPEKRAAHLQVIIEEADRLNKLVSDMLTLSRVQSGALPLEKSQFQIRETLESLLQAYSLICEQEGYQIQLNCREDLTIYADEAKIRQVVSNLLNNAVKYCGEDKLVIVSVFESENRLRFEITDHGMGIPKDEVEQVWERYYKASTNHVRSTSGTGLGLAIVKEILLLHNAKFGVLSQTGKGSTFWFEL